MAETYRADWLSAARAAASRFGGRTTCEACKSIDVRLWPRQGRLRLGACFSWSWRAGGEPYGNIDVRVEGDAVVLSYRVRRWMATDGKFIEQRVPLTWTGCHFGGRRPWFCCSVRINGAYCGRRAAVLKRPEKEEPRPKVGARLNTGKPTGQRAGVARHDPAKIVPLRLMSPVG